MKQLIYICPLFLIVLLLSFCNANNETPQLIEFIASECKEVDTYRKKYNNRIITSTRTDSIQWYTIFVITHCNGAQKGKIEVNKDTLLLKYYSTALKVEIDTIEKNIEERVFYNIEDCNCGFNLRYKIRGLQNKKYIIVANDEIIEKTDHKYKIKYKNPKFELDGNDTINLIDIYGLKQGLHIVKRKNGTLKSKYNFVDGDKISGIDIWVNFSGYSKVETYMENKKYTKRKYFKNGKVVKVCDTDGTFDEGINCIYIK